MRAVVIREYGTGDVLAVEDVPEPILKPRDVLIDVHAASLNPIDFKIRIGRLKPVRNFSFPIHLGFDVSGVVRKVGPQVTKFVAGEEVFATLDDQRMGAFSERAVADQAIVARKPGSLDHEAAAALPLVAQTSWQALAEIARIGPGAKVLVHAGAGGIGTAAIQLAKHLGASVATTTSNKNRNLVRSLGADIVIDYATTNFSKIISGYDVVLETLGGRSEIRSFTVLKSGGLMVAIAGLPDARWARANGLPAMLSAGLWVMTLPRTLAAMSRGARLVFFMMRPDGDRLAKLAGLADEGRLKPIIDQVFPMTQVKAAFDRLETGHARGKVILKMK
jgi:NADPH:quinone reductase-like Zn-dependent oxidoreductase